MQCPNCEKGQVNELKGLRIALSDKDKVYRCNRCRSVYSAIRANRDCDEVKESDLHRNLPLEDSINNPHSQKENRHFIF